MKTKEKIRKKRKKKRKKEKFKKEKKDDENEIKSLHVDVTFVIQPGSCGAKRKHLDNYGIIVS